MSIDKIRALLLKNYDKDELEKIDKAAEVIHRVMSNNVKEKINGLSDFLEATDLGETE
jgi:hypothetical protein